ncbi:guanosine-3',5'-bis(diphosphate) 3'-pyrophosphohydrolase [Flavobacterium covae]|uniref:bifunctional (p)ppGpp synthetase/guanosine-3',5'-bis(diphosphate) 3'-pyrophosphohydrolase n=1 Tax=Flavobacterium covae TaxID=2906076 RepID=UPI000B4CB069|nr:bifunctional (p)ppGpp synthetase/guanosine-3',5'-bis(diphosphate) 3'-pyrophosphohydrolase [Flavobacterium covae]OWP86775.1 guanosine-3',5'-bis(diphosphate) 3'-pyrophosphohydrolase [Flavobacterium covae]QYS91311.1 bifunctional (p)ppGpp synthetase/guanosine-3',5'-bis(diphosphate) 3'-pyrophosphohydrolase [Flavobacterium covae]
MDKEFTIDNLQELWQKVSLLHKGQTYGGQYKGEKIEYINHIGSVVFEIINASKSTSDFNLGLAIKCALLHDTLEDTNYTKVSLEKEYGKQVLDGVLALTKNPTLDRNLQMIDSLNRIQLQPKEVWAVKMADRICNLYAPPYYWNQSKKDKYLDEAKIIYEQLKTGNKYLAKRLLSKIEEYKTK